MPRLLARAAGPLVLPAYEFCMKASHAFNSLDARGAISVTERQRFIGRVRGMAEGVRRGATSRRAPRSGFPLLAPAQGAVAKAAFEAAEPDGVSAAALAAARAVVKHDAEVARAG